MSRIDEFNIPKGNAFHWDAPAKPMPEERSRAVVRVVAETPGVMEAYLPQCYALGFIDPPAQVLVITLARGVDAAAIMASLGPAISRIFPPGEHLDILPNLDRHALQAVRQSGMQIYTRRVSESQPWWKKFSR